MSRFQTFVVINLFLWAIVFFALLNDVSDIRIDRIASTILGAGAALGLHFITRVIAGKELV